jgi:hypothetical protein
MSGSVDQAAERQRIAGKANFLPVVPYSLRPAVGYSKGYSKALEYKYIVKTVAPDTLKRYSIISLTLYLE